MLGFLKKRKSPNTDKDDRLASIADITYGLLEVQKSIAQNKDLEDIKGIKVQALGYLWGFIDAALCNAGFDPSEGRIGAYVTDQVIKRLYPEPDKYMCYMNYLIENMSNDKTLLEGAKCGGNQYIKFITNKTPGSPMGFARYLQAGNL